MTATGELWTERLQAQGSVRDDALEELRRTLVGGLRQALAGRTAVDDAFLEDIAQESLMKVLAAINQFAGRSRFTTWATAIAIRTALSELRRRHWRDISLDALLEAKSSFIPTDDLVQTTPSLEDSSGIVESMHRLIETELTEKQRTALKAELSGMPLEEIGRRLGSNRNAIYKLTYDARQRLKRGLLAAGYSAADLPTS